MYKDIVRALDYSNYAEAALLLFVVAFAMIVLGALRLSRNSTDRFASIPLDDKVQDPRNG